MFNLEAAILEWRRQMRAAGIKTPDHLDELESHLREEIGRQMKAGRSEAEAFQTAVQKIGRAQKVQTEFAKVEASQTSRERKLKEVLLVRGPGTVGMTAGQQWSCLVAMAAFALMIWGGRLGGNRFPVIRARRRRNVINLSGIVLVALWWLVFFRVIVPGRDFTMAQFLVAFIWAFFIPAGVLLGMTLGLETAARSGRGAA
jgi:hypothetical protein